jgi:hypothetical protein
MKINKMTLYAPEGAVVMDNSFLIVWVVLAGCWYSSQHNKILQLIQEDITIKTRFFNVTK